VQLVEAGARPQQPEPGADPGDVRVDRDVVQSVGEQQHARGRLAPDARQRDEIVACLLDRHARQPVQRNGSRPAGGCLGSRPGLPWVGRDGAQDRLDAPRLHLRDAARPDRLLDDGDGRVAHVLPCGQALAQAQVGDIPVAVVGRLGQDGQHQLCDRVPVRRHARDAVHLAQPCGDAQHTRPRGRLPRASPRARRTNGGCWHVPHRTGAALALLPLPHLRIYILAPCPR